MHTLRQIEEARHILRLLRGLEQRYAIPINIVSLRAVHSIDSFLLFLLGLGSLILPVGYGLACSFILGRAVIWQSCHVDWAQVGHAGVLRLSDSLRAIHLLMLQFH